MLTDKETGGIHEHKTKHSAHAAGGIAALLSADCITGGERAHSNVSILNTPIKGQILLEKTGQMQTTGEQGYLKGAVFEIRAAENIVGQDGTQWYSCGELVAR